MLRGFAILKFSGSPIENGKRREKKIKIIMNKIMEIESLMVKYGWNEILSKLEFIPVGEFDPVWCNDMR